MRIYIPIDQQEGPVIKHTTAHLKHHNVQYKCDTSNCDVVSAVVNISVAERILGAKYSEVLDVESGRCVFTMVTIRLFTMVTIGSPIYRIMDFYDPPKTFKNL